jgi:hypothetical protein
MMAHLFNPETFRKYPIPFSGKETLIIIAPLVLREWSRENMKATAGGHSVRAQLAEAEFLVFNKLRSGVHPQILEGLIRKQLCRPLDSYYRQSYLLYTLKILRNLCSNDALTNIPTLQQYRELKRDRFLLARFKMDMNERFCNHESLHLKATDGAIESKLCSSLSSMKI